MHRVHHSVLKHETDSNYGFNLSFWDRIFRTYIDQPEMGHDKMTIGINEFRDARQVDQLPGMPTWFGAVIVIAAAIFTKYRETRR